MELLMRTASMVGLKSTKDVLWAWPHEREINVRQFYDENSTLDHVPFAELGIDLPRRIGAQVVDQGKFKAALRVASPCPVCDHEGIVPAILHGIVIAWPGVMRIAILATAMAAIGFAVILAAGSGSIARADLQRWHLLP